MKRRIGVSLIVCITGLFFHAFVYAYEKDFTVEMLERAPMPSFREPRVISGVLPNGLHYYLLPDHQIPIVHLSVIAKAGSIYDPSSKVGRAELAGISIRTGGTKSMTPEDLDKFFDDRAAEVSTSVGREMGEAGFKILSQDLDDVLPVFFEMIFKPRFEKTRVDLGRLKMIEALRREDDYPEEIAAKEFRQLVYGKESPWARRPTEKSIKSISISDLREFHSAYFVPRNMIIAAAGDFDANRLISKIEDLTKDMPNEEVKFPEVAPVELKFPMQKKEIKRKQTQAYIEMGHLGIKRHNQDKYAVEIMNMILGAPLFKSRLMEDIRSNRGLVYSISSDFGWGTDYGLFKISADTMSKNKDEVINLIEGHLKRMANEPDVTSGEVDFAKKSVLNSMIFQFDNSFKITYQRALYDFYGYPPDYWHIFRDRIKSVTVKNVVDAAHKYLHPDGLSVVVVGP
jgi:predicted Zn-dependent peptidase